MTTRLNVALPNVPGIKSLLRPASPSSFDISTRSYKWKRNAMENRHDMPLSSSSLSPSIFISISRIPSNRRYRSTSTLLPSSFLFILFFPSFRICQRFRPIDITPCLYVSFSHLSLFISISPLFESLFSTRSIPIVNVPISLRFLFYLLLFSLQFLFSKDSYPIIGTVSFFFFLLSISIISFKDSVQRYHFFSFSLLFLPFFFSLLFRSLFLSLFLRSIIDSPELPFLLPLSLLPFSRFTFIYSNFVLFARSIDP